MDDPRWDDVREREDARARVYEQRDRMDHDPRDGLMHDLDLPRGDARELVVDRDRVYELNGEDSRTLPRIVRACSREVPNCWRPDISHRNRRGVGHR